MGQRGFVPLPTAIKLLRGNPGKRPLPKSEPQIEVSAPECPGYLDKVARKEWDKTVPVLLTMRVLTEADQMALAMLCQDYSLMMQAQMGLKKVGLICKTQSGYTQPSPYLSIISKCSERILKRQREFGLTPSARVRLQMGQEPAKPNSKWAKIGNH